MKKQNQATHLLGWNGIKILLICVSLVTFAIPSHWAMADASQLKGNPEMKKDIVFQLHPVEAVATAPEETELVKLAVKKVVEKMKAYHSKTNYEVRSPLPSTGTRG